MKEKERQIAKLIMILTSVMGRASMLLFIIFLFIGALRLVTMGFSEGAVLAWDAMLSFAFFIQHSCMIRKRFRTRWSSIIPSHYHDAVFAIFSSIVLIIVTVLWQPSASHLYTLQGVSRWIARGIFILSITGMGWGVYALKLFDPFGNKPIRAHMSGAPSKISQFSVSGPYLWVRHPLYFFVLLLIWSCPDMTMDRLLFNSLWTGWIYVGTILEEDDLLSEFGDQYRAYQQKVPMLIPWKGFNPL